MQSMSSTQLNSILTHSLFSGEHKDMNVQEKKLDLARFASKMCPGDPIKFLQDLQAETCGTDLQPVTCASDQETSDFDSVQEVIWNRIPLKWLALQLCGDGIPTGKLGHILSSKDFPTNVPTTLTKREVNAILLKCNFSQSFSNQPKNVLLTKLCDDLKTAHPIHEFLDNLSLGRLQAVHEKFIGKIPKSLSNKAKKLRKKIAMHCFINHGDAPLTNLKKFLQVVDPKAKGILELERPQKDPVTNLEPDVICLSEGDLVSNEIFFYMYSF